MNVKVLSQINDHNMVQFEIDTSVYMTANTKRLCWVWKEAKWSGLQRELRETQWDALFNGTNVDLFTEKFTEYVLSVAKNIYRFASSLFQHHLTLG